MPRAVRMINLLRKLFGKGGSSTGSSDRRATDVTQHERHEWTERWNERMAAMERLLGPAEDMVYHAVIPLFLGGDADVVEFRQYIGGHCYVTSEMTGDPEQNQSSLGSYELMLCTREPSRWAPNLISRLARYTYESVLEPGHTMDIGPALPEGSSASALLFAHPALTERSFTVTGIRSGILLCMTILPDELEYCFKYKSNALLRMLKQNGVFPFSDLNRPSVVPQ